MKKIISGIIMVILCHCHSIYAQQIVFASLASPQPIELSGSFINVQTDFINNTGSTLTNADFYYSVDGLTSGPFPWSGNLVQGDTSAISMAAFNIPLGQYQLCLWAASLSDTLCYTFIGSGNIISSPYSDDFETPSEWASSTPDNNTGWQYGTPNYGTINTAHSGNMTWVVGLDSGLNGESSSGIIYSPEFDLSNIPNPKISFWQNWNVEQNWDGNRMEYSINGGIWNLFYPTPDYTMNWYTMPSIFCSSQPAWAGNSGGWQQSIANFPGGFPYGSPVRFRFVFCNTGSSLPGIAFDDFSIDSCNLSVSITITTAISCFNNNNGVVCANITGGTAPYTYNWSNAQTSQCISNLFAGNYSATVTDSNNCIVSASVTLTQPNPLTIITPSNVTLCQGTDLCVAAVGGTPPYNYLWSTGSTSNCLVTPPSGSYTITVTDVYGCSINGTFNLNYFPPMTLNLPSTITDCDNLNPTCVTVIGGAQPFVYLWSDSQTDSCHLFLNAGVYTITVADVNGCTATASTTVDGGNPVVVSLTSVTNSSCGMCDGIVNFNYSGGIGSYTLNWIPFPPPNLNALCENDFFEVDVIDQHACVGVLTFTMPLACAAVWPGDANYDGTANNLDLLPIGIGYGTTGPLRTNASLTWIAQPAVDWTDSLVAGTNYKHIDCNGDGTINDADTVAILQNYGQTHPLRLLSTTQNLLDPYLYFDITVDTAGTSQQLDVPLMFGTAALPADSIYGLAFTVNYDTALVKADSVGISFSPSWIGTIGTDVIAIQHNDPLNGKLYVGMTRIDHNNISGFGQIAKVTVVTVDNVSGRVASASLFDTLTFTLSDVTVIDKDENIRNVNLGGDSLIVEDSTTSIYEILSPEKIKVYPNPAKDKLFIEFPNKLLVNEISVSNVVGEKMKSESSTKNNIVEIRNLKSFSNGIYFIKIKTDKGIVVKKFSVMH